MPRRVPAVGLRERLVWAGMKGWPAAANSAAHCRRAKAPRSSWRGSMSTTTTPGMVVSANLISPRPLSSDDLRLRRGGDEAAAPVADEGHLAHDLVLQVPRQDHQIVGPEVAHRIGTEDRQVAS